MYDQKDTVAFIPYLVLKSLRMDSKSEIFDHLNSFFDHIYLISLKESTTRHSRIKKILDGLNYEIFWGVDGAKLNLNDIQEQGIYDAELTKTKIPVGEALTPGEIGCAMSHLQVYTDIITNGYRHALILEDDIDIIPDNKTNLLDAFTDLPQNWDLLYLGYRLNNNQVRFPILLRLYIAYPILNLMGIKKYNAKKLRSKFPRKYSNHLDLSGSHYGTHAYAVTASGAQKVLEYQSPISMASDNAIGMMCQEELINAFRVKRRIFFQNRELTTTIQGRYDTVKLNN